MAPISTRVVLAVVFVLLPLFVLLLGGSVADAAMHDKKRGFKTYKMSQEKVDKFISDHSHDAELNRHKNKEDLKQHPEYQRFKEWRQKHAAGDPEAGSAYAGKIPHDILHHITTTEHEDL